jgi:small neutral amino acid transporter SnatA (MarC family)
MILVFILLNAFLIAGKNMLARWEIDQSVVIIGNLILFLVSLSSFLLTRKSLASPNPNSFMRAMYGSFIIKFFVCAIAAFVYIMMTKKNVNKPALITCMALYLVYTFIEVSSLTKLLKQKKNA